MVQAAVRLLAPLFLFDKLSQIALKFDSAIWESLSFLDAIFRRLTANPDSKRQTEEIFLHLCQISVRARAPPCMRWLPKPIECKEEHHVSP